MSQKVCRHCGEVEYHRNHFAFVGNIPISDFHGFEPADDTGGLVRDYMPTTDCVKDFGGYNMGTYKGHMYGYPEAVKTKEPAPSAYQPEKLNAFMDIHWNKPDVDGGRE